MANESYYVPGPCRVSFGGTDLGTSKEGITIRPRAEWEPITDDAHGRAPADWINTGKSCVIEVSSIEPSKAGGLLGGTKSTSFKAPFENYVGTRAKESEQTLLITEWGGANKWQCQAVLASPGDLLLSSIRELNIPLSFLVVPDANGSLFQIVPSYIGM